MFWLIFAHSENSKCPPLARMQESRHSEKTGHGFVNNARFYSSHTSVRRCIKSLHPALFLVDSLLYFVVSWNEITAVRRPQIWRDECMAVGFTELLCTASLKHFNTLTVGLSPAFLAECQLSSFTAVTISSVFAHFSLPLPCLRSVIHVSRSLRINVWSLSFCL